MKKKWKGALVLFFLLGTSSLLTGSIVLYRTYELDNYDGSSAIMGRIVDVDNEPVQGAEVSWKDISVETDEDGSWILSPVDEGLVKISIRKDGYVFTTIKWLVYPMQEIGDSLEGSPNDISASFDIELLYELNNKEVSPLREGKLELQVYVDGQSDLREKIIEIGPDMQSNITLEEGLNTIEVNGNGSFYLTFREFTSLSPIPALTGAYPPDNRINLTSELEGLYDYKVDYPYSPDNASLKINWNDDLDQECTINVVSLQGDWKKSLAVTPSIDDVYYLPLPAGIYRISITGDDFLDTSYAWIELNISETKDLEVKVSTNKETLLDYTFEPNYSIAITYMVLGILIYLGGYLFRKRISWGLVLVTVFLGFLTWGMYINFILNINHILTLILIVFMIRLRKEYNERRRFIRKAKRINS